MRGKLALMLAALLVAGSVLASCSSPERGEDGKITVATSTDVLADLVRQVAGDRAHVIQVVPDGVTAQNFEPAPQDAVKLSGASLFFANGLGYEEKVLKVVDGVGSIQVISLSRGIPQLLTAIDHSDHEHLFPNPYMYMNVRHAITYVEKIRDTLINNDSGNTEAYTANAAAYIEQLRALDTRVYAEIQKIPADKRVLIKDHASFPYFASRYGLEDLAANYEGTAEAGPSPSQYVFLIGQVRESGVTVLFGEEGYRSRLLSQLARDTGTRLVTGLRAGTLGDSESYIAMMEHNARLLVENLR